MKTDIVCDSPFRIIMVLISNIRLSVILKLVYDASDFEINKKIPALRN